METAEPGLSKPKPPRTVVKAGRTLLLRDKEWVQKGHTNQKIGSVKRDSRKWRSFVKDDQALKELLGLPEAVVFRVKKAWYRLEPAPKAKPEAKAAAEAAKAAAPEAKPAP